ncbi:MAG: hypothetical protein ACE5F9_02805 [Phycisphaerae bacterium]
MFARTHTICRFLCPVWAVLFWVITGTGCQRPIAPEGPTAEAVDAASLDTLWDAALSVLKKHDFRPDRQDRAIGLITTYPTTSQHFTEFWRQDVADPYSFLHAGLHTTQRKATVRFVRAPEARDWRLEVEIDVYRLSTPEHQVTTASSAIQAFSEALPTTAGYQVRDRRTARRWVSLGRDGEMERRILDRILRRSGFDLAPAETGTVESVEDAD